MGVDYRRLGRNLIAALPKEYTETVSLDAATRYYGKVPTLTDTVSEGETTYVSSGEQSVFTALDYDVWPDPLGLDLRWPRVKHTKTRKQRRTEESDARRRRKRGL